MSKEKQTSSKNATRFEPLAIVGIGCRFPKADSLEEYWSLIKRRVDAITDVPPDTHWDPADYYAEDKKARDKAYAHKGGFLNPVDFDPMAFGMPPNALEGTDTTQLLGMMMAREALRDANYGPDGRAFDPERTNVVLGVTGTLELVIPLAARMGYPRWRRALRDAGVPDDAAADAIQRISESYVEWQESSFPGLLGNVAAGRIASDLDLGGTNCVCDAACGSALSAINLASMELLTRRCDVALTGGIDTFNDIFMYMCFSKTPALSPSGHARPFSADSDGTTLGEGVGLIVIKRLEDAERDGDKIYAVIKGLGTSSDGKGQAIYEPSVRGQERALRRAYECADVSPETIELHEAHGTGTKVGDAIEARTLTKVFAEYSPRKEWCALGSVKSQIGHAKAAAGAAGLIKAALALSNKVIPATLKVEQPHEAVAAGTTPFYVNTDKRPWLPSADHPRRASVSAFGFGGSNYHCVLEEYKPEKAKADWDGGELIAAWSADSVDGIKAQLNALPQTDDWKIVRRLAASSRKKFDASAQCRLVMALERDKDDWSKRIAAALKQLEAQPDARRWSTPDGTYFGSGQLEGKVAALFPGQGSQYCGMLKDVVCQFPAALNAIAAANAAFAQAAPDADTRLSDWIYPVPAFDKETEKSQAAALTATSVAQPALGAASFAALAVLREFGLEPQLTAGHSYGELSALCASGAFDEAALIRLSRKRGELMASGGGDKGGMIAVRARLEDVEQALNEEKLDLIIANKNAPEQCVISGATAELDKAEAALKQRKLKGVRLPVAAAFHSSLVSDACAPFLEALKREAFGEPRCAVFANATAEEYPVDANASRELLASQLGRPVEFVREIEAMHAAGARVFVEIGPGKVLSGLADSILQGQDCVTLSVDASRGRRSGTYDLGCALAQLAALGCAVDLQKWDAEAQTQEEFEALPKPKFTVKICGANYVKPKEQRPPSPRKLETSGASGAVALAPKQEFDTRGSLMSQTTGSNPAETPQPPANNATLQDALRLTQENLAALKSMQQQTAQLHQQFLANQQASAQAFQALIEQQRAILQTAVGNPLGSAPQQQFAAPQTSLTSLTSPTGLTGPTGPTIPAAPTAPAAPPQTKTPPAAPEPPAAESAALQTVTKTLLAVIAEKTGYPEEMLELDMGLDSDLGIDSIKRVEILSALQERLPELPPVQPEEMGRLRTLGDIVARLSEADLSASAAPVAEGEAKGESLEKIKITLLAVIADKTGYPAEMLELEMGLDSDLGIDSIKRVEILSALQEQLPELPPVQPEELGRLQTLGDIVNRLSQSNGNGTARSVAPRTSAKEEAQPAPAAQQAEPALVRKALRAVTADGALDAEALALTDGAVVWIGGDAELGAALAGLFKAAGAHAEIIELNNTELQPPETLAGLVLAAPASGADDAFLLGAFRAAQHCAAALRKSGGNGGAFFTTASRLDGMFGLGDLEANSEPLSGALAGLAKTAGHEWPQTSCRALDVAPGIGADAAAEWIVQRALHRGITECGLSASDETTLTLCDEAFDAERPLPLGPSDVVVISGGGRGVTAECAVALAEASKATIVLLGRSAAPEDEADWLKALDDAASIKKALLERAEGKPTPKELEAQCRRIMASREIRATLARIEASGAKAIYLSVDVRDAKALTAALEQIRAQAGPVTALIHGAGVLADKLIEDKTPEDFDAVYGVKVEGLRNLLAAIGDDPLKTMALFSSSTGRFGRRGQADYAMANEALNKIAQAEALRRPDCRVAALNWGPWNGGMVTPELARVFEAEGIGLIGLRAGAELLVRELSLAPDDAAVEVVVLGAMQNDSALMSPESAGNVAQPPSAVQAVVSADASLKLAYERAVTLEDYPFLRSHVLDGKAVAPAAIMFEWLGHAALHANPGMKLLGFNNLQVLKGVILNGADPAHVRFFTGKARKQGKQFFVPVEAQGIAANGRTPLYYRAEAVLSQRYSRSAPAPFEAERAPYGKALDAIYRPDSLFHGEALQGIREMLGCSEQGIAARVACAPEPKEWIAQPLRKSWLADPLALDCGFQLMTLWSRETLGHASLPVSVAEYRQFRAAFPADGVELRVRVNDFTPHRAAADMDFVDASNGECVAILRGYECVIDASLDAAYARNELELAAK
ncbi:SDR family NAD(P)-dependent oxidoreductase [Candidatus Sumerlaeota bacterium]|nr:SDR family NAD(P)-dependent oxidoreductase [Candidatus Sumerlaeota bacterium]